MKVIQIGKYYYPETGGIEMHTYNLANKLINKVEMEVIVSNTKNTTVHETINGVPVTRVACQAKIFSMPLNLSLFKIIKERRADIWHLHLPNPMVVFAFLIANPRGKIIVNYHNDIVKQKITLLFVLPLIHSLLKKTDIIIATSPQYIRYSKILSEYKKKCVVPSYGIDVDTFKETALIKKKKQKIRRKYGKNIVLFVGRLVHYKGLEYLIEAMSSINAALLIIGDGPLKKKLINKAKNNNKIFFLGKLSNNHIVPYYYASSLFVLPSTNGAESFGQVQLEAMVCGLPVISTKIGTGVEYINIHNKTGLLVQPGNVSELKASIIHLLNNQKKAKQLGREGKKRALKKFNINLTARETMKIYLDLVKK